MEVCDSGDSNVISIDQYYK